MLNTFEKKLKQDAVIVENYLQQWISMLEQRKPSAPNRLIQAVRHAVLGQNGKGGGKRIRAFLLMETAKMFGVEDELLNEKTNINIFSNHAINASQTQNHRPLAVTRAAASVELVHCYSLVHDDLPCMDNDTLRRGIPTVHVAYDQATALLAGNVILTHSFELLSDNASLIQTMIDGAGINGMLGGQLWDLAAEGRYVEISNCDLQNETGVKKIQSMKTGALIKASMLMGAKLGHANNQQLQSVERYAECLGLAFQISDDILDVTGDTLHMGKSIGKDSIAGKATFISLYGVDKAREKLKTVINIGKIYLEELNLQSFILKQTIDSMETRTK